MPKNLFFGTIFSILSWLAYRVKSEEIKLPININGSASNKTDKNIKENVWMFQLGRTILTKNSPTNIAKII